MKLLAIDGNSLINRAFYGIKLLTTKDGQYTNAVYGFINILHRLEELENPDGVAVAFDLKAPTFRHKKYSEYKAGRKGMPEELALQMPYAKRVAEALGFTIIEKEGYEADDILGSLANHANDSGEDVLSLIMTGDKDSLQLINDQTAILLATNVDYVYFDRAAFREKYGVDPEQFVDVKAIMGDTSDNIPGISGIGEKGALALISQFGTLEKVRTATAEELSAVPGIGTACTRPSFIATSRQSGGECFHPSQSPSIHSFNGYVKPCSMSCRRTWNHAL